MRSLLSLVTIAFLAGCGVGNTGTSPIQSPTELPQPTPTASAAEPTPSSSPDRSGITVDGLAVSTVDELAVRATPSASGTKLGTINAGNGGFVVAGPVSADGYAWYQLSALGLPPNAGCEPPVQTTPFSCPDWLGWVASGLPGGQKWLAAPALTCPASPMNLEALMGTVPSGPTTALKRLSCYRSSSIRVRGYWPQIPAGAGLGGTCWFTGDSSVAWLMCGDINYNLMAPSESAGFNGAVFKVFLNPTTGVKMPPRGQWVEVVGHFDDPAARDCSQAGGGEQDAVKVVLTCRSEFVAESVSAVAGPY